jgi:hypothetical protein
MRDEDVVSHAPPARRHRANYLAHADLALHGLPGKWEQLWLRREASDVFVLCSIPFFTYGMALEAHVEVAVDAHDRHVVASVVRSSGHVLVRATDGHRETAPPSDSEAARELVVPHGLELTLHATLTRLKLEHEWKSPHYVAIDVPDQRAVERLIPVLDELQSTGEVIWELANEPGPEPTTPTA